MPRTSVQQLPRFGSNHAPLLTRVSSDFQQALASFRFQNMWCYHSDFLQVVAACWALPVHLSRMARLKEKLMRLKQQLRHWNKTTFGDVFRNLSDAEATVRIDEWEYDQNPSDDNLMAMNWATTLF
ncbi:hypothetical protein Salat_1739600 [Sesamum alatum]|uniref:Uncharacterized protein n=1 Tax=Sesamum alatum TaxID=300844 RepID=A0AAE1Y870_9LAMI|nr:hypothetical protein Salat_1739600 [Sesamum alatum]